MAFSLIPSTLPHGSLIQKLALNTSIRRFFIDKWPTTWNTEKRIIFALRHKNYSAGKELLSSTYVLVTFAFEYGLTSSIISQSIWHLATFIIDYSIHGIFPAERIRVPWHSFTVAIVSATQHDQHICTSTSHEAAALEKPSNDNEAISQQHFIAAQTVFQQHGKHFDEMTTIATGINTIETKIFGLMRQLTIATHS